MEKTFEEEKTRIITASEERKDEFADISVETFRLTILSAQK